MMKGEGYPEDFSGAAIAAGGTMGILIPPSLTMVLICSLIGENVSTMFIAGILPGIIQTVLLCILTALAEDEEPWYYSYDRGLARQGMTLAAMTAGKAVDLLEGGAEDPDGLLAEFSNIDYLSPEKFIFVFLNSDQAATVRKALNVQEDIQIAPALAEYVNRKADNSYAEAASRVVSDPMDGLEMTTGTTILVLSYGAHIAVACEGRMALIIGTKEISAALNTEGVQAFAAELGSEDVSMRIYEGEDIWGEKYDQKALRT